MSTDKPLTVTGNITGDRPSLQSDDEGVKLNKTCLLIKTLNDQILTMILRNSSEMSMKKCPISNEFKELTEATIKTLLLFTSTYQIDFSAMKALKTKYRSVLEESDDLQLCLSAIMPQIDFIVSKMQAHPSH